MSQISSPLSQTRAAEQFLNIGQLVDIKWKLGLSTSSNECRNLNSPFVAMFIKVAEPSGNIIGRSFEMSLLEFKNFSNQIKDIAHMLETV